MKKILIAYFSHPGENWVNGAVTVLEKGNTRRVADRIQVLTDGDMFEIKTKKPYPFGYEACCEQAKAELESGARPELTATVPDFETYDIVYLGYPMWHERMPMAVYTFLEQYDFTGKWIVPYSTHEGSGLGNSVDEILRIGKGAQTLEALAFEGSRVHELDRSKKFAGLEKEILKWVNRTSR